MGDLQRRRAPRHAAALAAGFVLVVTGVAEFVRLIEPGATVDIRVFRGLIFLVAGIALAVTAHLRLRRIERA